MPFVCTDCRDPNGNPIPLPVAFTRHPSPATTRRVRRCPICRAETVTVEQPLQAAPRTMTAAAPTPLRT